MSIKNNPDLWLEAAVDAVNDFVINGLGELDPRVSILEYSKIKEPSELAGSYLSLNCGIYQTEVGLLVDSTNIKILTQKMLMLPTEEQLDNEQMSDALNEAVNIIAGGIKSRLNEQANGEITLGLPHFLMNTESIQKKATLLQSVAIGDLDISISIRITD